MTSIIQHAIVKSIVSGDTLIIKPFSLLNNENVQKISLNYIIAPKLARQSIIDQPYAFECREYLRKKLIEQEICYTIDFRIPSNNRLICTVYIGKDKETGENIIESLLSKGLVKLRKQLDTSINDPEYQRLILIDKQAKKNKYGRYSNDLTNNHIRNIKWTLDNPKEFFDTYKSQSPLDGIVEFIRDGNTVRCLLIPSYYFITIQLTGIKCEENFAEEAKQYIETRLLQRDVKIILNSINNQNLIGSLLHPNGNIALYLLKDGLVKCVDKSLSLLPEDWREKYRAAEKFAKDNRLRIWKNDISPTILTTITSNNSSFQEFQAKVMEIISGDALIIHDLHKKKKQKIYLSSIRGPHSIDSQKIKRPLYDIPYLFQARELLRKNLIGKIVNIVIDYIQSARNDYTEKIYCTIYVENVNISEVLVSQGLANVIKYRDDYEQRSSCYDNLLAAEQQAKKHAIGLFSTDNGLPCIIDMTGDSSNKEATKGLLTIPQRKGLLNTLKQNGGMEGIVEFVASPSRFRIYLLNNNWIISFLLSSINCPRIERNIESSEPFSIEAITFSKEHFLQRNVFIEIEHIDLHGNFIGHLTTTDGQSAALMLVQAGLAKVHPSASNARNSKELFEAEEKSQKDCIGIWSNYSEPIVKDNILEISEDNFKY